MAMFLGRFARWLHTGWPAGRVEKLPEAAPDGTTALPGVRIVGDLTGVSLLKLAIDGGAKAVQAIAREPDFASRKSDGGIYDLVIVGGGVAGVAAAIEAKRLGLRYLVFEAAQEFSTIANMPKGKPIFTYPTEMTPAGALTVSATVKEALLDELHAQRRAEGIEVDRGNVERIERKDGELRVHIAGVTAVRAHRVIIAIGRSGNYRQLGCPGQELDKVLHRLYDPADYRGQEALVVGGGDSAVETAIALAQAGARVALSYRKRELARPKPENQERLRALVEAGAVRLLLGSQLEEVRGGAVTLRDGDGQELVLRNEVVFAMIGREPPLDFFRRSGIPIRGEWRAQTYLTFAAFFLFCCFLYNWKAGTELNALFSARHWFPFNLPERLGASGFGRILAITLRQPGFYYSFAYCVAVALFGWRRIRRRNTPYITRQTITLAAVQVIPLFIVPYFMLPMLGNAGVFDHGIGKVIADHLFPVCNYDYGREYWRAFGLILAWPLFVWNFFTAQPMGWWLVIGGVQTFVIIPLIVWRWGKGAYCGWICSCGALSETLGDEQRHKMPHGPLWNRVNFLGQAILFIVTALFIARVISWYAPNGPFATIYNQLFYAHAWYDYYHLVDLFLSGIVGVGLYFWFSGRVWCRFACPLAALMHLYARFSQFRIFAEKKKCISCNVCTAVCHQGIDIMSFANKGLPLEDPECVRCSACVHACPTGTLQFGRLSKGQPIYDRIAASPVLIAESGKTRLRVL